MSNSSSILSTVIDERPPDVPRAEDQPNLGKLLGGAFLAMTALLDERLSAAGYPDVRPAHGTVFQVIDADGSRVTELAARAGMTKQAMGELVRHLEAGGYLRRDPDPRDGRAQLVRPTRRGWDCIAAARTIVADLERELAERWGGEPLEALRTALGELNAQLRRLQGARPAGPASPDPG
jgi:DNA-binding MarR family transcriptional regulator